MKDISKQFQTPPDICRYMVSLIPSGVSTVLEPTKGIGNIINELTGYQVTAPDDYFLLHGDLKFDCAVMNPPFTPMALGYQILYSVMERSDNIIALMPWLTLINGTKRTAKIFDFGLISVTHLPRSAFNGSRVQCCILNMKKGHTGITEIINLNQLKRE